MKIIIINLALVFSLKVFSQNNILINFINTTNTVAAGSTIYTTTTAENTREIILDIKNISNSTKSYFVKRYDIILNSVNSTTAVARFCFAGNCYLAGTLISPNSLTLTPGQSASSIQGDNQVLSCDLDEAAAIGYSYIKYSFINAINSSDSLQFSIKYNDPNAPLTIMETSENLDAFNFYPNPVSDELTFKIKATKNDKSILNIYNGLGAITIKKEIYLTEGENIFQIKTSELPVGIYFAALKINNSIFTKKLIIK
jgi:hypothetical protein